MYKMPSLILLALVAPLSLFSRTLANAQMSHVSFRRQKANSSSPTTVYLLRREHSRALSNDPHVD
jgi:hypothetical protein